MVYLDLLIHRNASHWLQSKTVQNYKKNHQIHFIKHIFWFKKNTVLFSLLVLKKEIRICDVDDSYFASSNVKGSSIVSWIKGLVLLIINLTEECKDYKTPYIRYNIKLCLVKLHFLSFLPFTFCVSLQILIFFLS